MKRLISFVLAFTILTTVGAGAAVVDPINPNASLTLISYVCDAQPGEDDGEIIFGFSVDGKGTVTRCGVAAIRVYKGDGTFVTTITGTNQNGLLANTSSHANDYVYTGVSGETYYGVLIAYAAIGSTSDRREMTTPLVTAP